MTAAPPPSDNALPFRRLLFMPWRWNRWVLMALPLLFLAGYVLSAAPVIYFLRRYGLYGNEMESAFTIVYFPLVLADENCRPCREFFQWEYDAIRQFFGD
jgi:hypothetical protein